MNLGTWTTSTWFIAAGLLFAAAPVRAEQPSAALQARAEVLAKTLAAACPMAPYDNEAAFQTCANALRQTKLPFAPSLLWGGEQPDKQIKKKNLTHFNSQVYQTLYLPLYMFTGRWSVSEEPRSHTPEIVVEAYFRNTMPPGNYPYPFWHSGDKWNAYEKSNELRFYIDRDNRIFIVTRDAAGSEERRGAYAPAVTPAFTGDWQWHDEANHIQPHVSLFSARFRPANPYLDNLDKAYRTFALKARDTACLDCHTPANKAESERLVLLQTPLHAAGEIDNVIKAVESGEMPQDEYGLRKDIPAVQRSAIRAAAIAFRDRLTMAAKWETEHPLARQSAPNTPARN